MVFINWENVFLPRSPAKRENMIPVQPIIILAKFPFHKVLSPTYYLTAVVRQSV